MLVEPFCTPLAVDFEPELQVLRIGHFVFRDEPGTEWAERVAALALVPQSRPLDLKLPLRHVVNDAVAGDEVERPLFADILGPLADHDAELDLPIGLLRTARKANDRRSGRKSSWWLS